MMGDMKGSGNFSVTLEVSQFRPEELSVNVRGHELVITGHHEERVDNGGTVERHFVRTYALPKNAKVDELVSKLGEDGVLNVSLPTAQEDMRKIPIQVHPNWKPQPCRALIVRDPIPLWWW